jgi:Ca-activated chloride channel family protein
LSLHHFSFAAPAYLVALILVPLFLVFAAVVRRRRATYTVAFTNLEMLAGVTAKRRGRLRRHLPLALLALAIATAVAAVARPTVQSVASDRSATVVLLADVSGSMQATDVHPARIYAAVTAMHELVDRLPASDKVGLITFSDKVDVLHRPTVDHAAIHSSLDVLSPEGGTALGDGVEAAVKMVVSTLAASGVYHRFGQYLPAAIVLESDGAQDRGLVTPFSAAQFAKAAGVRIYGVALGTRHGYVTQGSGLLTRSIRVLPSPGTVALLARESGGLAFSATNAESLDTIYRNLGSSIGRRNAQTEIASWFELVAAILLVAAIGTARARGAALP